MKIFLMGAAVGAMLWGALPAAPARADSVTVRAGENGVAVRTNSGYHRDRHHRYYRSGWRSHYAGCRTVHVRTRLPNGNVVVRTRRTCG